MQAGGSTVLECASSGDADGVKRLLNLGEDADEIDSDGNTALHCAAEAGLLHDITARLTQYRQSSLALSAYH